MSTKLRRFSLAFVLYLIICATTVFFTVPFSYISFIGPLAGVTTALVIFSGTNILFVSTVVVIIFSCLLSWYLNLNINSAMVIITILAIMVQSYWAKQLTLREISQQNWLKSRQDLFIFLLKIGPLTSIVCASAILVITMLDNEVLTNSLFYTFISSWSDSLLFAIFFTPSLLLTQKRQQLTASKRVFIIFASSLAFLAIGLLFNISQSGQLHDREDIFLQVKTDVTNAIEREVNFIVDDLHSLSAFIKASDTVSFTEFDVFTEQISHNNSTIRALEWAPIIEHAQRANYEQQTTNIMERSNTATMIKATERKRYAPIHYVYPSIENRAIIGFDVLTNSTNVISMEKVINSGEVIASTPLNLIQDDHSNPGILFISSVYGADDPDNSSKYYQNLLGFVVAVVQFEDFFRQISKVILKDIDLFIEDVSSVEPHILFGSELNHSNRHVEQVDLNIYSRHWKLSLVDQQPWQMQQKSWQAWGMLIGVTFGGVLFQLLILMMAAYSSELSAQVLRKTQELIIAKDLSEQRNMAKTNFLNMLSRELQAPLQTINHFVQQINKVQATRKKITIDDINLAQENMSKLLTMAVDLSKIESGELIVQSESIDFHGFLVQIDEFIKAQNAAQHRNITLLVDPSVPHFINSDELRIQQLLTILCESVNELFAMKSIRLTVKVHHHHNNTAILLFAFTQHGSVHFRDNAPFVEYISKDISQYSTQMAMAKEICQLMEGDVNLSVTKSGEKVLTASIKISQTTSEQQYSYQTHVFDNNIIT